MDRLQVLNKAENTCQGPTLAYLAYSVGDKYIFKPLTTEFQRKVSNNPEEEDKLVKEIQVGWVRGRSLMIRDRSHETFLM
jgi:hypothetical protein